jgi:hypothetical protein
MSESYKTYKIVITLFLTFLFVVPLDVMSQDAGETAKFSKEEIAQMVAPIALYPDSLVAQILMASTYPLEVVEADRWIKQNPNLKGDSLDQALKDKTWDVSVKSLCHFPDVLSAMSQNLDKTAKLGDAVLSQQKDVMDTIQELRHKAQAQGNLKTTEKQKVIVEPSDPQVIVIEPAEPQVVYVPSYNPAEVYGSWAYPAYPPYAPWYYPFGGALVGGAIGFGIGYAVGSSWGWSNCNWGHGDIDVNIDRTNNFNRIDRSNKIGNQNWRHNAEHRRGVAYRDNATSQRFGQSSKRSTESRRQARGYGELGSRGQSLEQGKLQQGLSRQSDLKGAGGKKSFEQGNLKQGMGRESTFKGSSGGGRRDSAFSGMGNGNSTRMSSQRGSSSRQISSGRGSMGGSRGGMGGGGRRGGGGGRRR